MARPPIPPPPGGPPTFVPRAQQPPPDPNAPAAGLPPPNQPYPTPATPPPPISASFAPQPPPFSPQLQGPPPQPPPAGLPQDPNQQLADALPSQTSLVQAIGDAMGQPAGSGVIRDTPDVTDSRRALVTKLTKAVTEAKRKYKPTFDKMRADLKYVRHQRSDETSDDNRARVNVLQRHVANKVAGLYAKNPTFVAEPKKRMEFAVWDGSTGTIKGMLAELQATPPGAAPSPMTQALLADIQQGVSRKRMLASVGKTMEALMSWSILEQSPPFKPRAKRLVRRAITTGVGYLKIGYQRQLTKRPDIEAKLSDITDRLARMEQLQDDQTDKVFDDDSASAEELKITQTALEAEPQQVVREGLVIDFPHSTRIIPDLKTKEMVGWVGSHWVAEEFILTTDEVQEIYGVDLKKAGSSGYTGYKIGEYGKTSRSDTADKMACVWEIYHRLDGVIYAVCDGYPDFLKDPVPPDVAVDQFIPIYPLLFNEAENEDELFPPSDVEYLRPSQNEINRKREAIRQHRIAARPFYIGQRGKFSEEDVLDLNTVGDHEIIFLNALDAQEKIENIVQPFPTKPIDPNLYEVQNDINDMMLISGTQQANLGKTGSDTTATESSIAEASRVTSMGSNIDDLDEFLSLVAHDCGALLLANVQHDTVVKVVGPGAVWPELTAQEIAEEIYLSIEAGSSGRPNKEQELANAERVVPMLLQIPGVSPEWLAKYLVRTLDSNIDIEDAVTAGLPAILTMNKQAQVGTGNAQTDPNQQGPQGADNAPQGQAPAGGPQPAMPAPSAQQPNIGTPANAAPA
jgi:hypothetical protein